MNLKSSSCTHVIKCTQCDFWSIPYDEPTSTIGPRVPDLNRCERCGGGCPECGGKLKTMLGYYEWEPAKYWLGVLVKKKRYVDFTLIVSKTEKEKSLEPKIVKNMSIHELAVHEKYCSAKGCKYEVVNCPMLK